MWNINVLAYTLVLILLIRTNLDFMILQKQTVFWGAGSVCV